MSTTLSNAVAPTFNKVIKRVIEQEDQALAIANAHMYSKPDLNRADISNPRLIELDPEAFDGVVIYSGEFGETAVIVQDRKVIWTGMSNKY
jgi:TATA-box binding protein (TBP) (component of TFIID and TFIIIB)